jgi:UDPglucose--hexose-1-phosphate uridylyltransferase
VSAPPVVRIDQVTGLRTILAAARAERPIEFKAERPAATREGDCPFCEGHEDETPPEFWADRDSGGPDTPGWRTRSVPNLYPALAGEEGGGASSTADAFSPTADPLRAAARGAEPDLFTEVPATGVHEVIVHSPRHVTSLAELDDAELASAVGAWRERMRARAEEAACLQLIVNEGPAAGASLEHSHAQLYALGFVPALVARERERFNAYHERTQGGDLLADVASEEVRRAERLVAIDDDALLICPWASRSPFELRIVPRRAAARFEDDGEAGVAMLGRAYAALGERFGGTPQLNLWVRTAPRGAEEFHWHIDIAPRLSIKAGFELATGVDINIYPPERAAAELKDCLPA